MTFAYPAIIHPTEKGYTATFPDLTDCAAEGDTVRQIRKSSGVAFF